MLNSLRYSHCFSESMQDEYFVLGDMDDSLTGCVLKIE